MTFWQHLFSKEKSKPVTNQLTLKERLSALRNLPKFFKLVWETNKWMTITNALLRILKSATPLAILYVGKLIIDEILLLSNRNGGLSSQHLWMLVAIEFGLAILSDSLSRAITLIDSLLGDRFSNHTSVKIMSHAATLDLDQFENSAFYDKLERARQQTIGRTILLSQVMGQVQDLITMAFLAAGLLAFNPWLIILLLVAIIPAFLGEAYFNDKTYALSRRQTPERRE
ncbi:MAG: transporter ATP-binding protein, partial [Segetibacter sp.]|nr:transporter ATP-binding protein [Segetibacter sp.]